MREFSAGGATLRLERGDITTFHVDAIVNAANSSLLGGGGVDGAIHRAGGPAILEECRRLGGCPTGEARITTGGRLSAQYVIHTVGPIWRGGQQREPELLASAYRSSLTLAKQRGLASIAFPSISTGAYAYPLEAASRIALQTSLDELHDPGSLRDVTFVLFDDRTLHIYEQTLEELTK
jgi:O-acetyl-ADP-ribose deacetylase (regulator of RNase III)